MVDERAHLAEADRHIAEFRQRTAEQEARVEAQFCDGACITLSVSILRQFREALRLAERLRRIIVDEIAREKRFWRRPG